MRAKIGTAIAVALLAAACGSAQRQLEKVSWGTEFDGEFPDVLDQAVFVLRKEFPRGLDPDKTREEAGDLWTIWHYKQSVWYRGTTRQKAHVVIEPAGEGKVRVGVSVVRQLNDSIDNPSIIEEARWTNTTRDTETAARIEKRIAQRYLRVEPSEAWKEKHRDAPRGTLRQDIIDRNRDIDLGGESKPGEVDELPPVTGRREFWDIEDLLKKKKKKKQQQEKETGE